MVLNQTPMYNYLLILFYHRKCFWIAYENHIK
jgi:hypothetical protein